MCLRVWDMMKPYRPLLEKNAFRQCNTCTWLPNGVGCLAGFGSGGVKLLGFPEDALKVRIYRQENSASEGVWSIDSTQAPKHGTLITSGGQEDAVLPSIISFSFHCEIH